MCSSGFLREWLDDATLTPQYRLQDVFSVSPGLQPTATAITNTEAGLRPVSTRSCRRHSRCEVPRPMGTESSAEHAVPAQRIRLESGGLPHSGHSVRNRHNSGTRSADRDLGTDSRRHPCLGHPSALCVCRSLRTWCGRGGLLPMIGGDTSTPPIWRTVPTEFRLHATSRPFGQPWLR